METPNLQQKGTARQRARVAWGQTIRACGTEFGRVNAGPDQAAVFLDRDGTLIVNKPYNSDPGAIELLPGVIEGLRVLQRAGYLLVVVTNQAGVARGYFDEGAIARHHRALQAEVRRYGVRFRAFYYCPHHVDGVIPELARACDCRKPGGGMILRAASDLSIDPNRSWLIGDQESDVEAGRRAGCRSALIDPRASWPDGRAAGGFLAVARMIAGSTVLAEQDAPGAQRAARRW